MKARYIFYCLFFTLIARAQTAKDYAILVQADVSANPAFIHLKWKPVPGSKNIEVYRKLKGENEWGQKYASLVPGAVEFKDSAAVPGVSYEYFLSKADSIHSYINAGIRLPEVTERGKLLLLVDQNYAGPLAAEIDQLKKDLVADGWQVKQLNVSRSSTVPAVKNLVKVEKQADSELKALYILGHIAVPYSGGFKASSGNIYPPDGHPDHGGAWPTDLYYGSFNESFWTDVNVNDNSPTRAQNRNIPGDGKFDQMYLLGNDSVALQIGRVDLTDMPLFTLSDTLLTKQYLTKAHAYKTGQVFAERRALVDDHFGPLGGEAFASTGWRTFTSMFGDSVFNRDYIPALKQGSYLFTYGTGPGSFTTCNGVATTQMFNSDSVFTVFTMLFGSYFGDWDATNVLLKAPLCSRPSALASMWSGRPYWHMQHMTMGEHIGYSAQLSQNNYYDTAGGIKGYKYNAYPTFISSSLMGDPTLRLHAMLPPPVMKASTSTDSLKINLSWGKSPDATDGYAVLRSLSPGGPFTYIKRLAATDSTYTDPTPFNGINYYMVRAIRLEQTPSGSYYNLSLGLMDSAFSNNTHSALPEQVNDHNIVRLFPNPSNGKFTVELSKWTGDKAEVEVYDLTGRKIHSSVITPADATIDAHGTEAGLYMVNIRMAGKIFSSKLLIQ